MGQGVEQKKKKAFIRIMSYPKGSGGINHLLHVYRKKTIRKLANKYEAGGATMEELMVDYSSVNKKKTKPAKNLYLEIMIQGQEAIDRKEEILKVLDERFKGHKIGWVAHYDESSPHIHILISWCSAETGKALRLSKKDLGIQGTIAQSIIKIINQSFTPKGQGRRMISLREYMANEEAARKEIEETRDKNEEALSFIQKMLDLYKCKLKLTSLGTKGGRLDIQDIEKIEEVKLKRMRSLERYGFGLYFYPDADTQRAVFLDDVKEERLKDFPKGVVIVKTSDNKYQVHIPVPDWVVGKQALRNFQKALITIFDADKGASAVQQLRRLAGFVNQKYEHKPVVVDATSYFTLGQGEFRTLEELWSAAKSIIEKEEKRQIEAKVKKEFDFKKKETKGIKSWDDFYDGDESVADARYVYHLFINGFTDEEIKERLRIESKDLYFRKRDVEYYLDLTVSKVKDFVVQQLGIKQQDLEQLKNEHRKLKEQNEKLKEENRRLEEEQKEKIKHYQELLVKEKEKIDREIENYRLKIDEEKKRLYKELEEYNRAERDRINRELMDYRSRIEGEKARIDKELGEYRGRVEEEKARIRKELESYQAELEKLEEEVKIKIDVLRAAYKAFQREQQNKNAYKNEKRETIFKEYDILIKEIDRKFDKGVIQLFIEINLELIARGYDVNREIERILSEEHSQALKDACMIIQSYAGGKEFTLTL